MLTWIKKRSRSYQSSHVYADKLDRRTCIEMAIYDYEMRGMHSTGGK